MAHCDDPYPWLSEFLCEYVDGAMPAAERAAFEEHLAGDPALAAHVLGLIQTRERLGCLAHTVTAPCGLAAALQRRLACPAAAHPALARPRTVRRTPRPDATSLPDVAALSSAALWRSAALLLVLGAVAVARFALYVETTTGEPAPPVAVTQALLLAPTPAEAVEFVSASAVTRPVARRAVHAKAPVARPAVVRDVAERSFVQTHAVLRIGASR